MGRDDLGKRKRLGNDRLELAGGEAADDKLLTPLRDVPDLA